MAQDTQNSGEKKTNPPSHIVWYVPDRENAPWTRIGAMWPTAKGNGFRQVLDMMPIANGHIVVLPYEPKEAGA